MKREPFVVPTLKAKRSPKALAISIAIHAVALFVLSLILVHTRVGDWVGIPRGKPLPQERISYVNVAPAPAPGAPGDTGSAPAASPESREPVARPIPLAPIQTPRGVREVEPVPAPGGVPGGRGGGGGGGAGGTGPGTGMVPSFSDSRIWAPPGPFTPVPKAPQQVVDSVIDVAVGAYLDSLQVAARTRGREPGDWTVGDGDTKWGVDSRWIHFGKVKIPTALLAMLPINAQSNPSYNARERAAVRWDIDYHAQRSITEDEFKRSVKRIRERMEKEREKERQAAAP